MTEDPTGSGRLNKKNVIVMIMLLLSFVAVGVSIYIASKPIDTTFSDRDGIVLTGDQRVTADANNLIKSGLLIEAVRLLEAYVNKHPNAEDPGVMLAKSYFLMIRSDRDNYLEAVRARDKYNKKHGQNAMKHLRKDHPKLSIYLDQWERCSNQIEAVLKINPLRADILWLKGEYLELKSLGDGIAWYRKAAEQPDAGDVIWGMYGQFLLQERQVVDARHYLEKAISAGSRSGKVHLALGKINMLEKKHKQAEKHLLLATQLNPSLGEAWWYLGMAQRQLNDLDKAIVSLRRAEKSTAGGYRGLALQQLGECYIGKAQWPEAAEVFMQAAEYPPEPWVSYLKAAQCYYFSDAPEGNELGKAMVCIDKAASLSNNADVLRWKKKIEDARYGPVNKSTTEPSGSFLEFIPKID